MNEKIRPLRKSRFAVDGETEREESHAHCHSPLGGPDASCKLCDA